MALSGLDIYKLLPKTNCKKCGFQTCLAFAMQLAKKAVSADKCPFVSSEVRAILEEASMPAIRLVCFGRGGQEVRAGNETVLFRHEERFHHPTAIGLIIEADSSAGELCASLDQIAALNFERVGEALAVDLIAFREGPGGPEKFLAGLEFIKRKTTLALVLMPKSLETLKAALGLCVQDRPLVLCPDLGLLESFALLCKDHKLALGFGAKTLEEFFKFSQQLSRLGIADMVFNIQDGCFSQRLDQLTQLRRLAIKKRLRPLGYPAMVIVEQDDPRQAACAAAGYIAKYAGIVLIETRLPEYILPLLTLRQNIFTDPRKPLQVVPGVYPVGAVDETSPVVVTTNFSLTYYTVLGEIEASRRPCHLVCVDCEGMSVLTAWAAEKFTAEKIAQALTKFNLKEKVGHDCLIIPGYVAVLSGEVAEFSGWKVLAGPREASGLKAFLRNLDVTC